MPLKVAIGVATDEIMDLSCKILAKIPQSGIVGKIIQYMMAVNNKQRVGTAARPLTVVSGVATRNENEFQCPELQEAPQCANADKSVQQEESVLLDLGVGTTNCPPKVARGETTTEKSEKHCVTLAKTSQCGGNAKKTQFMNGIQVSMGLATAHPTKVARSLPTSSVNVSDKVSDVLDISNATKTGELMTGNMYAIVDGLGTAV